ncbi:MAG TPA: hypothetical protein PLO25_02540 [Candidatus Saccharibacteria bacterium]|nr:hypothetical protein [Candidatus Saccharibacteria bacterium]
MDKELSEKQKEKRYLAKRGRDCYPSGGGDAVYGLGLIGALIYFISNATTFWMGVLGILKALVWPAFVVYEVLKFFIK